MRKFKALIAVLTAAVLVFSLVGTAFAAGFPDVSGVNGDAANRIRAFGIVHGYTDGTFHPNENVTREQFCKMVVNALGQGALADVMKNDNQGNFKDVRPGALFTGYINVAVSLGVIQGYPDKTFKGGNPVSYYEAALMLTRAVGREGDTDSKTFATAVQLGLFRNVAGSSNYATRGHLAQMVANMLKVDVDPQADGTQMAMTQFLGIKEPVDKYVYATPMFKAALEANQVSLEGTDATFPIDNLAVDLNKLAGAPVTYYERANGEKVYLELSEKVASVVSGVYKEYKATDSKIVLSNGEGKATSSTKYFENGAVAAQSGLNDEIPGITPMTLYLDASGNIISASWVHFTTGILAGDGKVIKDLDGKDLKQIDLGAGAVTVDNDAPILLNGKPAAVTDLKKDDVVYVVKDSETVTYIEAYRAIATGTVEKVASDNSYIIVSGKKIEKGAFYDESVAFNQTLLGKDVKVLLDKANKAAKVTVTGGVGVATSVYGYCVSAEKQWNAEKNTIETVFTVDVGGTVKTYVYEGDRDFGVVEKYCYLTLSAGKIASAAAITPSQGPATVQTVIGTGADAKVLLDNDTILNAGDYTVVYAKDTAGKISGVSGGVASLKAGDKIKYELDANNELAIVEVQP